MAIILVGTIWHYLYDWTGNINFIAYIAPVNESVWEHFKLGVYGITVWSIFEVYLFPRRMNNYFLAKAVGFLVINLTIILVFFAYLNMLGHPVVWIDILSFVIGAFLAQFTMVKLYEYRSLHLTYLGVVLIFMILFALAYFTYHPPELNLFIPGAYN